MQALILSNNQYSNTRTQVHIKPQAAGRRPHRIEVLNSSALSQMTQKNSQHVQFRAAWKNIECKSDIRTIYSGPNLM